MPSLALKLLILFDYGTCHVFPFMIFSLLNRKISGKDGHAPLSVVFRFHHFQTISPLRPLCQLQPYFIPRLLGLNEVYSYGSGPLANMAAMFIYGKNPFKYFLQNQETGKPATCYIMIKKKTISPKPAKEPSIVKLGLRHCLHEIF